MGFREIASEHYLAGQAIRNATVTVVKREFRKLDMRDLNNSFYGSVWPQVIAAVELGQRTAAGHADSYLDELHDGLDALGEIDPDAFAGTAADGRTLESLLEEPLITTKTALSRRLSDEQALAAGETQLAMIAASETTDAGRTADGAALVARPELQGYVRLLTPPSCSRCVLLAGRYYRWSDGFERHPQCDCRHVPVTSPEASDPLLVDGAALVRAGKVKGLSKADRQAIIDGADMSQVINARRGMYTAGGRKMTREGTTRRGWAGKAMAVKRGKTAQNRLRPESIYKVANSRGEAISLLRKNGYFVE